MGSSLTPSADEAPSVLREALARALPEGRPEIAACAFHFVTALDRLAEGIRLVACSLENPTAKKMGMAVSSILMRAREAAAYWRRLEPAMADLASTGPYPVKAMPGGLAAEDAFPVWNLPEGPWLSARCAAVLRGQRRVRVATESVEAARDAAEGRAAVAALLAEFRDGIWPALAEEDGLLKGLPRLQEEITKRIYRAEAFGE